MSRTKATFKFSPTVDAQRKRMKRLPELYTGAMFGLRKMDAVNVIKTFQDGIKMNSLGMKPLADSTKKAKKSQGLKKPETPLYGMGLELDKHTYINMLKISRLQYGWKVFVSKAKHWKSKLNLYSLFLVHEYGRVIWQPKRKVMFRIPPRPAFLKSYLNVMEKIKRDKRETSKQVKQAITDYMKDSNDKWFKKQYVKTRSGKKYENDN